MWPDKYNSTLPPFDTTVCNDYYQVNLESSLDPNCFFFTHLLKIHYVLRYAIHLLVHIQGFQKYILAGEGYSKTVYQWKWAITGLLSTRVQRKRWPIGDPLLQGWPLLLSCSTPYSSSPSVTFYRSIPCSYRALPTSKPHVIFKILFNTHIYSSQRIQFYVNG